MKYLRLILAALSLLSFSFCSLVKFENFGSDILGLICDYLNDPAGTIGSVNAYGRKCLIKNYTSKHFTSKKFQIPELKNIDENEPELRLLLSLSSFSSDPLHVF